jgi:hypothetical protein
MDWIHLAQDTDQWRILVNMVMNLGFHKMLAILLEVERPAASQQGLSSMKLVYDSQWLTALTALNARSSALPTTSS